MAVTREEDRFGELTSLGTTYTIVGAAVPSSTKWNVLLNLTNRHATITIKVRIYVAANSWASGEPTGSDVKAAIAYDTALAPGEVQQISGIIMKTTEKLIARSDTASSLDLLASGVAIVTV